jgi:hypothetical protein
MVPTDQMSMGQEYLEDMKSSCKKPSSNSAIEAPMDGSGDNPQILQIPVHLPGYTQCFTRILPAFYPDITSVLPGYYQRFTWIFQDSHSSYFSPTLHIGDLFSYKFI